MPTITNHLRLLFHSSSSSSLKLKPSFSFSLLPKPRLKPYSSSFTLLALSSNRRRPRFDPHPSRGPGRRNISTFRERKSRERGVPMEGSNESSGFNKRRAEGRDKDDKPKKSLQLKTRKLNPSNTICYLQDTSPSVLLFFDRQRFIFNAGEGLQRFCTEQKIKLSKIDHIFLSRVCSETAGGLPGLLLTLAGVGEGLSVCVWGPSDLKYLVDAMRSFIPNAAMVNTKSFGPALGSNVTAMPEQQNSTKPIVLIDDEVVKISAIVLQPTVSEGKPGDMSVVYVCELPEIKGRFDKEKALALGVRPGRKYSQLVEGQSVKSDHQDIMVHPSDVMDPSLPGPIVVLVDCPKESYLQQLLSTEHLNNYFADFSGSPESSKVVSCIIHLSPASVVNSPKYQNWMKRFGSAQHIMAGHERKNMKIPILKSSARITARLNYLCPQFFPAPDFCSLQQNGSSESSSIVSSEDSGGTLCESIGAESLQKFVLRPHSKHGLDKSCVPSLLVPTEIIDELHSEIPDIVVAAQNVSQLWNTSTGSTGEISCVQDVKFMVEEPWLDENTLPSCLENISREDMEIVFLGTGSSQPSKYRNVSSIHINLFSKGGLLLDCGEGTLGQLKRRYGVDGADDAVRGLRCIWISHIHADHHTGLARILALRHELLKEEPHEPILVVGPRQLKRYLDAYQRLEDLDIMFLDCQHTTKESLDAFKSIIESSNDLISIGDSKSSKDIWKKPTDGQMAQKIDSTLFARGSRMQSYWQKPGSPVDNITEIKSLKKILGDAGLEALISFPVVHCPQAFGVVLKAAERTNSVGKSIPGWKVVYSGDTRPCEASIEASRNVRGGNGRGGSGKKPQHDRGSHRSGERCRQRYPKIPVFDETHMHNTCIAFDMMSVNVADLPVLPRVLPYLKMLFRNEMALEESDDVQESMLVHPSDVMDSSHPGPIVLLVDCPNESHLQQLLSTDHLNNYFTDFSGSPRSSKVVNCIIHLSPASVVNSPKYQNWMKRFGSAQHIMAGHERKNMKIPIFQSSARMITRLNYLCQQFFPSPESTSIISNEDSDLKLCESIAAENLQKFVLRPHSKHGLDKSCVPSLLVPTEIIDELHFEIPDIAVAAQNVKQLWHTSTESTGEISSVKNVKFSVKGPWLDDDTLPSCLENIGREDMEIVFLGTGSSQPSKYRNVSSIHINLFSKGGLLLDCGEGTLGQLKRRYGVDKADDVMRGLRCIWISHMHADHYAGLARILVFRRELLKEDPHEPALVIGPKKLKRYLDAYQRLEDLDMVFLDCQHTTKDSLNGKIDMNVEDLDMVVLK
ncbi:hypothetical protein F8388_016806 [Cannabis sativa]|uniref:ribonuclease Z n=1 Tax=Cannabis sativa TaxID=3483 RepID=A0A7J6ERE8_CANSA|nr:hypothetical protein F8388_016806 [Cannabis sativa]